MRFRKNIYLLLVRLKLSPTRAYFHPNFTYSAYFFCLRGEAFLHLMTSNRTHFYTYGNFVLYDGKNSSLNQD